MTGTSAGVVYSSIKVQENQLVLLRTSAGVMESSIKLLENQ